MNVPAQQQMHKPQRSQHKIQTATVAYAMSVPFVLQATNMEFDIDSGKITAHKRLLYANKLWWD
jgi:hypothetical protein